MKKLYAFIKNLLFKKKFKVTEDNLGPKKFKSFKKAKRFADKHFVKFRRQVWIVEQDNGDFLPATHKMLKDYSITAFSRGEKQYHYDDFVKAGFYVSGRTHETCKKNAKNKPF